VVLLSLVLQGLTMPWMLHRLKVAGPADVATTARDAVAAI
jgi:NhaP-type Na+/H+ and K+/H+ antiporter